MLRGDLSMQCCERGNEVNMCWCSYPLNAFSLVSVVLQPHPCILGFSEWCLILKQLLVVLVKGSKVRNDLCYHLSKSLCPLPSFCHVKQILDINMQCLFLVSSLSVLFLLPSILFLQAQLPHIALTYLFQLTTCLLCHPSPNCYSSTL